MDNNKKNNNKYFQEALSDFIYDAASGRAIRHLTDNGCTAAQIVQQLDYPVSFAKVQHTVTRYLKETGILLEELPVPYTNLKAIPFERSSPEKLFSFFAECIRQNGEENSYLGCPFGAASSHADDSIRKSFSMLTAREREYIEGIAWEPGIMYHRLNRRMLEIGVQAAMYTEEISFCFLKSGEIFIRSLGKEHLWESI